MNDPHDPVVVWQHAHKRRGKELALADFSLALPAGRVCGLIGRNGAGKTTAIETLLGMLAVDAGEVHVFGQPAMALPWPLRQRIGYLAEHSRDERLPDLLMAGLLAWQSCYFANWDAVWCERLVKRLDVPTHQRLWSMSEGQRRRAEVVLALAHRPQLLVLDDPALGLDALARRDLLWTTIDAVRDQGTTVLFTSHVLQDVERVVDDVCIVDRGRVRLHGALEDVLARSKRLVLQAPPQSSLPGEVHRETRGRETVIVTTAFDERWRATLTEPRVEPLNLEEIFCTLVADAPAMSPAGATP